MILVFGDVSDRFQGKITKEEFERIITEIVQVELPDSIISSITYDEQGLLVEADDLTIEIQVDWEEIILT
jgi:YD repeat-containing protein